MVIDMRRKPTPKLFTVAARYRVIADGVDVTKRCFRTDTRLRRVGLYVQDEQGHVAVDWIAGEIKKEWLHPKRLQLVRRIR